MTTEQKRAMLRELYYSTKHAETVRRVAHAIVGLKIEGQLKYWDGEQLDGFIARLDEDAAAGQFPVNWRGL